MACSSAYSQSVVYNRSDGTLSRNTQYKPILARFVAEGGKLQLGKVPIGRRRSTTHNRGAHHYVDGEGDSEALQKYYSVLEDTILTMFTVVCDLYYVRYK
jgi:hypothetical protein